MEAMVELKGMFKTILREEVRKALRQPTPNSWKELIIDPTSQQLSMSRLCFGALILGILILDFTASILWLQGNLEKEVVPPICGMNTAALVSVAGVYGFNSVAGAARGIKEKVQSWLGKAGVPGLPEPLTEFPDE